MLSDYQGHYLRIKHERDSLQARIGALKYGLETATMVTTNREDEALRAKVKDMEGQSGRLSARLDIMKQQFPQELGKF